MRVPKVALLLVAALAHPVFGAVRWEMRDPNALKRFPSSNATAETITTSSETPALASISTTQPNPTQTKISTDRGLADPQRIPPQSTLLTTTSSAVDLSGAAVGSTWTTRVQQRPGFSTSETIGIVPGGEPGQPGQPGHVLPSERQTTPPRPLRNSTTHGSTTGCSDDPYASSCLSLSSITPTANRTWHSTSSITFTVPSPTSTTTTCYEPGINEPITEYSIVYTETITFYGNRTDYTPPYPTIQTQDYCPTVISTEFPTEFYSNGHESTSYSTVLMFTSDKERPTSCSEGSKETECLTPAVPIWETHSTEVAGLQRPTTRRTVTFITTDKNPSVVYPSDPVPQYSQPQRGPGRFSANDHQSVPPDQHGDSPQSLQRSPQTQYVVTAQGDQVIINDKTYSDLKPGETSTITVGEGVFTIYPTAVVGEGATVNKPEPANTAISVATPTSTTVGGIPVVVSGTEAVIDGSTFSIPSEGTSTKVNDMPVSIGPGRVIVNGQTMTFRISGTQQTDVVVTGGEMITAIGQSIYIYHSTTITYGPGIPETHQVVDDDTITIGPSGVVVNGITMGGAAAETTETHYEIVGGATVTKMSPSNVIIEGTTFTVGPGATTTTKIVGGETITIGPSGVAISSMTWTYPFGSSTVTTISASMTGKAKGKATATDDFPTETKVADQEDDDSAGSSPRPGLVTGFTGVCIAIGVLVFI